MVRPVFSQRVRFNSITHDNPTPLRLNSEMVKKKDDDDEDDDEDSDEV